MEFNRFWASPSHETFSINPIKNFVNRYIEGSKVSIDPFARNKQCATYTNDLNPNTKAEYHMDAYDFLVMLKGKGVKADLVLFDPPYSRQQVKEVYQGIGRHYGIKDTQYHTSNWRGERNVVNDILTVNGHVLSFGWNSAGMGKGRGYKIEEITLICHGGARYDTICIAERKRYHQLTIT